jgi:urease accessory protein
MMRATARVVARADAGAATRLTVLYGEPPLLPRQTGPGAVYLVGGAAGPLGGDDLRVELDVGPHATLVVRSVAASVVLPGPDGSPSRFSVAARVADGGRLAWLPEPVIAATGCNHSGLSTVELIGTAVLTWREELVCGRHGEDPGDVQLSTVVRLDGQPLYQHRLAVGPDAPGWDGAAVLGGARAFGSVLLVNQPTPATRPGAAVLSLAGPGALVCAIGAHLRDVRAGLDPYLIVGEHGGGRRLAPDPYGAEERKEHGDDGHQPAVRSADQGDCLHPCGQERDIRHGEQEQGPAADR